MRGQFSDQGRMFSYLSPEERVPKGHPLRAVRAMVRAVLEDIHGDFARLYSSGGRPPIRPEQLLSALLLQVFYGHPLGQLPRLHPHRFNPSVDAPIYQRLLGIFRNWRCRSPAPTMDAIDAALSAWIGLRGLRGISWSWKIVATQS